MRAEFQWVLVLWKETRRKENNQRVKLRILKGNKAKYIFK